MTCPSDDELSAYAARALPEGGREALESHAAGCLACREVLRLLADPAVLEAPPRPAGIPWRGWKVAAALLLAVSLVILLARAPKRAPRSGKPSDAPASATKPPSWPTGAGEPLQASGWAAEGIEVIPQAGARALLRRGEAGEAVLSLSGGGAWIWTASGSPLLLETPAGSLRLGGVGIWAGLEPGNASPLSLLMREASAGSGPTARVVVIEGTLDLGGRGEARTGTALRLSGGAVERIPPEPALVERLLEARRTRLKALGGWKDLLGERTLLHAGSPTVYGEGMGMPRYRFLAGLEGRSKDTELTLIVPTPSGPRQWTALLPARGAGSAVELEILFDGAVFRARVDGRTVSEIPRRSLERALEPAEEPAPGGWGIRSWGGTVTLSAVRVQELP